MKLVLLHPEVAYRDCQHCLKFLYDDKGKPVPSREAEISGKDGKYRERDSSCPPECRTDKGCPKGTPEKPKTLTPENTQAWIHYRECKATNSFPDDPIVRRNATIIREIEEYADGLTDRLKHEQIKQLMMASIMGKVKR